MAYVNNLVLSGDEKFLISRTWNGDFAATFDLAISIYEHLFQNDLSIAALFPDVDVDNMDLRGNPKFSRMAMRLVRLLATAVHNLNEMQPFDDMLDNLVILHMKFVERGLQERHWDCMNTALRFGLQQQIQKSEAVNSNLTEAQKDKAIKAWFKIVDYITDRIRVGVYAGLSQASDNCPLSDQLHSEPVHNLKFCGLCGSSKTRTVDRAYGEVAE